MALFTIVAIDHSLRGWLLCELGLELLLLAGFYLDTVLAVFLGLSLDHDRNILLFSYYACFIAQFLNDTLVGHYMRYFVTHDTRIEHTSCF